MGVGLPHLPPSHTDVWKVFLIAMAKHVYMWLAKGSFNRQTNLPCGERCIKYKAKNLGVLYKVQDYKVRVLYIPPFAKGPKFLVD
jgi:hypothetical protein